MRNINKGSDDMGARVLVIGALAAATLLSGCGTEPNVPRADAPTPLPTKTTLAPTTTTTTPPPPTTTPTTTTPSTTKPKPTTTKPKPKPANGAPCSATAAACVKLSTNQAWLLRNGEVVYGPVPITSGMPGYRTPPGTFRVQWKDIDHKSREFNNAPMPYSVFFNGGIAFHTGSLRQQSHGCIHLSNAAAKTFYNSLPVGAVVQVVR
jgi:lipoprotein-anchoring transpeptidase ErfK/SrfK